MARVRIEPVGTELDVKPGETVFEAALREGMSWPTICFGQVRCTACALKVLEGHANTDPAQAEEQGVLRQLAQRRRGSQRDTRLACRLTVTGEVTVEKKGAGPADDTAAQGH
jgi:ferredoxin